MELIVIGGLARFLSIFFSISKLFWYSVFLFYFILIFFCILILFCNRVVSDKKRVPLACFRDSNELFQSHQLIAICFSECEVICFTKIENKIEFCQFWFSFWQLVNIINRFMQYRVSQFVNSLLLLFFNQSFPYCETVRMHIKKLKTFESFWGLLKCLL